MAVFPFLIQRLYFHYSNRLEEPGVEKSGFGANLVQKISHPAAVPQSIPNSWYWFSIALFVIAVLPYLGAWNFEFVNFDDPEYITENPNVLAGLTWESVQWAMTANHVANWHPLTWISHMLDVELFGLNPGGHHLTNVILHAVNTVLLFGFLACATGCTGRSALVAAMFAVHPLHVESVAWVSERKDVLSTLFMFLTLFAYLGYTKRPSWLTYLPVFVLLALGLMAKPMLVTLPCVLLLLDAWPLNRISLRPFDKSAARRLVIEKLPLFALVAVSAVVTFLVQLEGGAVSGVEKIPIMMRLSNVLVSYVGYIVNMITPTGLAVLYPFPESIPVWKPLAAVTLLIAVTMAAIKVRGTFTYVSVGWFWFLGTLVPVIGIVQVGSQAMADRYTYIPLIGLFIILVWGAYDLLGRNSSKQAPLVVISFMIIIALTAASWMQSRHWQNSHALWSRAIEVTERNSRAHNKMGIIMAESGHQEQAIGHYRLALKISPNFTKVHNNFGNALAATGRPGEALAYFKNAISLKPDYALAHNGMGSALDDLNQVDEAIVNYEAALRIDPQLAAAHNNLAAALFKQGNVEKAITESKRALELKPARASYHVNYAVLMYNTGDFESARQHLETALRLEPGNQQATDILNLVATGK